MTRSSPSAMHFVFPANPMRPNSADEMFADQVAALREVGFTTSLCPDAVILDGKPLRNLPAGATVVYRGWMLKAGEYEKLESAMLAAGATPFTTTRAYRATHHLPNWYALIAEYTPETRVLPLSSDWEAELRALKWDEFFVKDYVKSLKTSRGSILRDPSEIGALVSEMTRIRGEIEGGLCVRRVESFIANSERRYFVLDGKPFAAGGQGVPNLVHEVAPRIPARFFSVDVIQRADGTPRIVEIGDGQVSDLVGWTATEFAAMWAVAKPAGAASA